MRFASLPTLLWLLLMALPVVAQQPTAPRVTYVLLESSPSGARVYDRNYSSIEPEQSVLGRTPLTLPLDRNVSHTLWLMRDGYQLERVVVSTVASGPAPPTAALLIHLTPTRLDTWLMGHPDAVITFFLLVGCAGLYTKSRFRRLEGQLVDALLSDPSLVGRVIGDYRISAKLGEGGFSTVYRAEHIQFGEIYALKLLKSEASTPLAIERFNREMQLGRDLKHPGLIRVWSFGWFENRPYLVMDLVEGRTLSEEQGSRTQLQLLELFIKVCEAVQALHDCGLIHRDLKPDNIMVLPDSTIRVLDFGAAKHINRAALTVTGTTLGTPLFMSPEHLDAKGVDQRSDIYSAGVILFFLMTGRTPFDGESTMEVLLAHLDQAPPETKVAGLPADLEAVIQRMLAKSPGDRYASMSLVVKDLLPIVDRMRRNE